MSNKMNKEISSEKMSRIISIQTIGKATGNPYQFDNLARLTIEELNTLQDMEIKRWNAYLATR